MPRFTREPMRIDSGFKLGPNAVAYSNEETTTVTMNTFMSHQRTRGPQEAFSANRFSWTVFVVMACRLRNVERITGFKMIILLLLCQKLLGMLS
jgi:hypothetical protein